MTQNKYKNYIVTRDGEKIYYETNFDENDFNPSKILIVLNNGLVCSVLHWSKLIPYLTQKGYQVLTHDYRGHFKSTGIDKISDINFNTITKDIHEILLRFNTPHVVHMGHSMGVNVSLEFAKNFPDKSFGLVLISGTVVPPEDYMFDSNIISFVDPLFQELYEYKPKAMNFIWENAHKFPPFRFGILQGGFNKKKVTDEYVKQYMQKIGELGLPLFFQMMKEMNDHDIINYLDSIQTPSLIIGGDRDNIIPNYLQKILLQYLKKSEIYIVKDGSHVPQIDFPEVVNERIFAFLEKIEKKLSLRKTIEL